MLKTATITVILTSKSNEHYFFTAEQAREMYQQLKAIFDTSVDPVPAPVKEEVRREDRKLGPGRTSPATEFDDDAVQKALDRFKEDYQEKMKKKELERWAPKPWTGPFDKVPAPPPFAPPYDRTFPNYTPPFAPPYDRTFPNYPPPFVSYWDDGVQLKSGDAPVYADPTLKPSPPPSYENSSPFNTSITEEGGLLLTPRTVFR